MTNPKTTPDEAPGPADSAAAPSASAILLEINAMRQRLDAIAVTLSAMIGMNEPAAYSNGPAGHSDKLSAPSTGDKTLSKSSVTDWKGMKLGDDALQNEDNDLPTGGNTLPNDADARLKDADALTNKAGALPNDGNDHTKEDNTLAKSVYALAKNDDTLTTADKLSRTKFKVLPWDEKRIDTYQAGGKPRYNQWWRSALPARLVEKVAAHPEVFGRIRLGGQQAIAGIYIVLYYHPGCSRTELTGRLQLHPDHVKRYVKHMKRAGHLSRRRPHYEVHYELTGEGRKWVEGD